MDKIACIGSREVPPEKIALMESIGEYIVRSGAIICSGNAAGADQAYARGANKINPKSVFLCLPWASYEKQAIHPDNHALYTLSEKSKIKFTELASKYHPAWPNLTQGVKTLMIRNAAIVWNSKAVIAYLNHSKKGGGGTGHGWRIAEGLGIKRIDISQDVNLEDVKNFLQLG